MAKIKKGAVPNAGEAVEPLKLLTHDGDYKTVYHIGKLLG